MVLRISSAEQVLCRVVRVHIREGRYEPAQTLISSWSRRCPSSAAPVALQALLYLGMGEHVPARDLARKAVGIDARNGTAYFALAQVYVKESQLTEAMIAAQRAVDLGPDDVESNCLLAQLMVRGGSLSQAQALLREVAARVPGHPAVMRLLAEVLMSSLDDAFDEAERLARKACEAEPHFASAWALHANALLGLGRITDARDVLEIALVLDPDQPKYLMQMAQLALVDESRDALRLENAANLAHRAGVLAPSDWRASFLLSRIQRRQGHWSEALRTLTGACATFTGQHELLIDLAEILGEVGQLPSAFEALSRSEALGAPLSSTAPVRGKLLLLSGDFAAACATLTRLDEDGQAMSANHGPTDMGMKGFRVALDAQGVGQCLLFLRYVKRLKECGVAHVTVIAPAFMATLIARVAGVDAVSSHPVSADWTAPISRLPVWADTAFTGSYLCADAAIVSQVRQLHAAWREPVVVVDLGLRLPLAALHRLGQWLTQHNAIVVVPSERRPAWLPDTLRCVLLAEDDLEGIAGWVLQADAVMSSDLPLAHLAGGMGVEADVLLPLGHDPVWGSVRSDTPLYPTLRLHRETTLEAWARVWENLPPLTTRRAFAGSVPAGSDTTAGQYEDA